MYRATYTDNAGRTRKCQGYFVLNKVNRERYGKIVVVRARDKVAPQIRYRNSINCLYLPAI